jgi:hypothetical protein
VGATEDGLAVAGIAVRRGRELDLGPVEGTAGIGVLVGVDRDHQREVATLTTAPEAIGQDGRLELDAARP